MRPPTSTGWKPAGRRAWRSSKRSWREPVPRSIKPTGGSYAENHSVFVVRRQSRGSGELLCVHFQEFKNPERQSVWRSGTGAEGNGHDREIPTRRARISGAQRGSAIHLLAGRVARRELRDAAGSGRAVGEAFRRRQKTKLLLADG